MSADILQWDAVVVGLNGNGSGCHPVGRWLQKRLCESVTAYNMRGVAGKHICGPRSIPQSSNWQDMRL